MLPNDTVTVVGEITGNTTHLLVATSTYTVINIRGQQSGTASQSNINCGTTSIAINYGKDYSEQNLNYTCKNKALYIVKTGNDKHFYSVSYVQRDRHKGGEILSFQEAMVVYCIIIALLSIMMWKFIFHAPKKI